MRTVLIDNIWLDSRRLDHTCKGLDFGSLSQMCLPVMMAGEDEAEEDRTKSRVAVLKLLNKVPSMPVHPYKISTAHQVPPQIIKYTHPLGRRSCAGIYNHAAAFSPRYPIHCYRRL
jgi:hypothetical protein